MRATDVERADVYCDAVRAGTLERTPRGSRFTYEPAFLEACRRRGWGLGFRVPLQPEVETQGVNLHPFFAGLLPEGVRLAALERAVKTSRDDLFSLLLAAGSDAVGDVRVVAPGETEAPPPVLDLGALDHVSFAEVLQHSLDYQRGGERRLIPGVQPKVSAAVITLPVRLRRGARAEAMLKLEPKELPRLVANEHFFMTMARRCGLEVADVAVVHDQVGASGLLVTRFDRQADAPPQRLHCEDGCQFLDRYPADKYRLTFKDVAEGVRGLATAARPELVKLLQLLAFSYLIANGDLHARNVSLLVDEHGLVRLAPAYDLLATLPYGDRRLAMKVLGRDDNLTRAHLVQLGHQLGLAPPVVSEMLEALCDAAPGFIARLGEIGFAARPTRHLERVMRKRRDELGAR